MQPLYTPDAQPYWDGLQAGQLRVQRCSGCGALRHYPRPLCPGCHSFAHEWIALGGAGTVHSWTVLHQSGLPELQLPLPLTLLTVDMAEGVRVLGRLRHPPAAGAPPLQVGAAVRAGVAPGLSGVAQPVFDLA